MQLYNNNAGFSIRSFHAHTHVLGNCHVCVACYKGVIHRILEEILACMAFINTPSTFSFITGRDSQKCRWGPGFVDENGDPLDVCMCEGTE